MEDSESALIRRAQAGEEEAFHRLVDEHAQHLFGLAYGMLGRVTDAEDVVQETFLATFQGLRRFEGRSSLRTWMAGILTRQVALWHRKRRSGSLRIGGTADEVLAGMSAPGSADADARLDVVATMKLLSPEYREVLLLREYEGMSYEQIASALDIPRGTVESRLYRARQELRQRLTGYL